MPVGNCRLCSAEAELQLSHVIPAFIFRWSRETSANGFLRFGSEPNKRVQDGLKFHWLCAKCEARFSRWEDRFARHVFHPIVDRTTSRIRYGPWLMQFGVSVIWRVLGLYRDHFGLTGYPEDQLPRIEAAEKTWREYLLGQRPHPGVNELHLLPVDAIGDISWRDGVPPTINRYFMRMIDTDVVHGTSTSFVYVKLPRFFFLGFTLLDHPKRWVGTKVHATEGMIEPREFVIPKSFGDYVNEKARRIDKIYASMSPRQLEKIDESILANLDKLRGSDLIEAMARDVEMFGKAAFRRDKERKT
jgi:hypothetical protein